MVSRNVPAIKKLKNCTWHSYNYVHNNDHKVQSTHFVIFQKLDSFFLCAVSANRTNVDQTVAKLDKSSSKT